MPGWPRLVLIGGAFLLTAVAGVNIERDDESPYLYAAGVLALLAMFWGGAHFLCENEHYVDRKRAFWPGPCEECGSSVIVRFWGFPFPDWVAVRDVEAPRLARELVAPAIGIAVLVGGVAAVIASQEAQEVEEDPNSPGYTIVRDPQLADEIDDFRAVEPKSGWETEYEINDGDAFVRFRDREVETEVSRTADEGLGPTLRRVLRSEGYTAP
jgi:hypothetical protein